MRVMAACARRFGMIRARVENSASPDQESHHRQEKESSRYDPPRLFQIVVRKPIPATSTARVNGPIEETI